MSLELFAIGSSGLALVTIVVMVLTRVSEVPAQDAPTNARKAQHR